MNKVKLQEAVKSGRPIKRRIGEVYSTIEYLSKYGVSWEGALADDWEVEPEALKPCPFCGGDAHSSGTTKYTENHEAWFSDGTQILFSYNCGCTTCGASTKGLCGQQTKEKAIEKWNRRKP
jgi:Lar family restriction alleviation protein